MNWKSPDAEITAKGWPAVFIIALLVLSAAEVLAKIVVAIIKATGG